MRCLPRVLIAATTLAATVLASAGTQAIGFEVGTSTEYILYRTGVDLISNAHDETLRIHVATFDASQDFKYNHANCEFAQEYFNANQPHYRGSIYSTIKIKYWCEKGRFRK
jgi:hypothetical protein